MVHRLVSRCLDHVRSPGLTSTATYGSRTFQPAFHPDLKGLDLAVAPRFLRELSEVQGDPLRVMKRLKGSDPLRVGDCRAYPTTQRGRGKASAPRGARSGGREGRCAEPESQVAEACKPPKTTDCWLIIGID